MLCEDYFGIVWGPQMIGQYSLLTILGCDQAPNIFDAKNCNRRYRDISALQVSRSSRPHCLRACAYCRMVNSCHCGKQWLLGLLFIAVDISFRANQHLVMELSALSSLNRCSKSCTLDTVDQFIGEEMNRISAHCVPQIRDGLIGPEEIKVSGAVLYEIDRLGVSLLFLITLPKLTVRFCCCSD